MTDGADNVTPIGAAKKKTRKATRPAFPLETDTGRAVVMLDDQEDAAVSTVLGDLSLLPLFQRAHSLVSIVRDAGTGAPSVRALDRATLRTWLTRICEFQTIKKTPKGDPYVATIHPPDWLTNALAARGEWAGVPALAGIIEAPTVRPDGSVLQAEGYDPATRLALLPGEEFPPVPEHPTRDDAVAALAELQEVWCDFPFASEADAIAPVALVLTLVGRGAITGAVPMIGIDANVRGSGKSLVANAASCVAYGRAAEMTTFRADPEEQEKTLASYGLAGTPFILFDNLGGPVGGAALDKCLTAPDTVAFRNLGKLEKLTIPWRSVLGITGNNLVYRGDTARRVYRCRIESDRENPEDRDDFRHHPLLPWVVANRARLVTAALTVLRAHALAGRPRGGVPAWGSYEVWSEVVAAAIVWAGGADPQATRRELEHQSDEGKAALSQLLGWWPADREFSTAQLVEIAGSDSELRAILDSIAPGKGPLTAARVGYGFRNARGRIIRRKRLAAREGHHSTTLWSVDLLGGDSGHGGHRLPDRGGDGESSPQGGQPGEASPPSPPSPPPEDDEPGCFDDLLYPPKGSL
ncbi:MAG TPA: hypothetical protein PLU22_00930 [Polyangiaceae bacterium]|nr:hypothetical protein [Polyangiaceae bacterium]